ncbi:outer membrane protein assembly factor BamB [Nocardia tenerifensis]|uniref:Outer membrane protein assembly factor BamB n=1 Tax=Nocardia tenerifensis TaxID=228006 RepID=A0A318K244_9NOCA|nr:PQQ-binding-like beta-propeller repeat protein [Nocardia tenerifensis]PXX65564.1 outer membrane protein assembly factor BamB [Nocardia tenerifensis]
MSHKVFAEVIFVWWTGWVFCQTLWERQLHQRGCIKAVALTPESVVVHERNTRLVSLDRPTGSLRWDVSVGRWPRAVHVTGDRCLVIAQNTHQLSCLNVRTGALLWNTAIPPATGHLVTTADTVLAGGWRNYSPLMAFDLETGARRWETTDCVDTVLPALVGDGVLIGVPGDTVIRLIRPGDGEELSRWRLPEPLISCDDQPAFTPIGPDRFLARCGPRSVVDIRLSSAIVREFVRAEADLAATAVEYNAGMLWLRELRGGYLAVDPVDGRVLWRVNVREALVDHVAMTRAGLVVATHTGALLRLDSVGQVLERTAVARRISALRTAGPSELLVQTKGTLLAAEVLDLNQTEEMPSN